MNTITTHINDNRFLNSNFKPIAYLTPIATTSTIQDPALFPTPIRRAECGLFGISEDFLEKYQSLDERFIKNKTATFFFESVGKSMEPTIFPGEILVVDRSIDKWDGKVCVLQYQGELICKRVYFRNNHIYLHSDNPKFKGIKVFENHDSLLWGVVIARIGEVS